MTDGERAGGRLSPDRVELAAKAFAINGFVFIEEVLPPEIVAACRALVQADIAAEGHKFMTFAEGDGIGTSFFDFCGPFADDAIVANPVLLQLLAAIVGPDVTCSVYNTNVSKPGARQHQPVHTDVLPFDADGEPFSRHASVHFTLCEFTEENGSTELWPGTHKYPTAKDEDLSVLAAELPSVRANLPAGSLIVRDATTWHRGRVNQTAVPREMLSMFFTGRGTKAEGNVYGRPLVIRREVFEGLPAEARRVWGINEVVG